jgi:hypothetical protein
MQGPRTIEGKAGAKAFSSSARADADGQFTTQANDQGEFVFADLPADVFALRISFGDSPPRTLDGLIVPRAGTLALGDVELARGATLRGVVRTAEGDSPVGFSVALDTGEMVRVREADGRFELTGLAPGAHWLQWWRGDSQFQRHRVDFDVAAGETRELVIDAVASAPCRIEVRVRRNGQPAANVPVIAVPAAKGKGSAYLGTTNAEGVVIGQVEGGVRVIVQALSAAKRAIGAAPAELVTVAGGSLACTIDVECGTLSLELPVELARPENGRVMIQFADGTSLQALTSSGAPTGPKEFVAGPLRWSTNRIDFGEVPAGTRDAEVRVERYERAPDSDNPKLGTWILLREPYKTKIAVQDGGATHVVVP